MKVETVKQITPAEQKIVPIEFDLGSGVKIALPGDVVAKNLIESLRQRPGNVLSNRLRIGEYIRSEGGIYVGDILGDDRVLYGLIMAEEMDIGAAQFGADFKGTLSQWDGLSNTNALRGKSPAADLAAGYERDGHCDFYLPARRELMVPLANVPHLFNKDGWYQTSTSYSDATAWAVYFEYGFVNGNRYCGYRVRPFRRFTH